jgi:hypothetical protein
MRPSYEIQHYGFSFSATIIRQCVYKNNLDRISTQIAPQLIGLSSSFCRFFHCQSNKNSTEIKGEKRFPLIQWAMSKMRIKEDLKRDHGHARSWKFNWKISRIRHCSFLISYDIICEPILSKLFRIFRVIKTFLFSFLCSHFPSITNDVVNRK